MQLTEALGSGHSLWLPVYLLHPRHHSVASDPSLLTINFFIYLFFYVSLHSLFVDRCANLFSQTGFRSTPLNGRG